MVRVGEQVRLYNVQRMSIFFLPWIRSFPASYGILLVRAIVYISRGNRKRAWWAMQAVENNNDDVLPLIFIISKTRIKHLT